MKRIKLTANILFSGIGCQERGFRDSGLFDIEVLNTSDINKESVLAYAAIHCGMTNEMVENYKEYPSREEMAQYLTGINLGYEPEKDKKFDWFKLVNKKSNDLNKYWLACKLTNNLGDISKIEELSYADFWTCSFPCTDISVAGKMKGLDPDSGTRSSLLWENIKLLKKAKENNTLPKYIMVENVKNLVSKKFIDYFNNLISIFEELGFNTYWSVINGKDCGVPQNRERVFIIAIRKDIDTGKYTFPKPFDTGIRLKDVLEKSVEDKYYLSEELQKRLKITDETFYKQQKQILVEQKRIGGIFDTEKSKHQAGSVYDKNCLSPTLDTMQGGWRQPLIVEDAKVQSVGNINPIPKGINSNVYNFEGLCNTLTTVHEGNCVLKNYSIRKLTPRECFKLMGFTFEDCDKAKNIGVADSHLYKQAGNGIITNCCKLLAEHLYKAQYDETYICEDESMVIENDKEIEVEISEEELNKLSYKQEKKTGYERVKKESSYYYVDSNGFVEESFENCDDFDDDVYNTANYYSSDEVADNNARADELMRQLRRFTVEHREQEIDWYETADEKYVIAYNYGQQNLEVEVTYAYRKFGVIYFDTEETAQSAIDTSHDELIWYFTEYKDSL